MVYIHSSVVVALLLALQLMPNKCERRSISLIFTLFFGASTIWLVVFALYLLTLLRGVQ